MLSASPIAGKLTLIPRREFLLSAIGFGAYALLREAHALVGATADDRVLRWIRRQDELARSLASGTVSPLQWHDDVARLAREVDVEELADAIGKAQTRSMRQPTSHEPVRRFIVFRDID